MSRQLPRLLLLLVLLAALPWAGGGCAVDKRAGDAGVTDAGVKDAGAHDSAAADGGDAATVQPDAGALAALYPAAAGAICGALYRCCNPGDVEAYFGPHRESELLTAFRSRLPPAVTLDEAGCRTVVAEMLAVTPLGDWVRAAEAGAVEFDRPAFDGCVAKLAQASCGQGTRDALYDSACFGFAPPSGGTEQRKIFRRTAQAGATCSPLRDGVGAVFYGTCDPSTSFCCYQDPANPGRGCSYPFNSAGVPRAGRCVRAAHPSERCQVSPPLSLCTTGASCDSSSATCVVDPSAPLATGAACADASFNLLGLCQASFCDVAGTKVCEPLRPDGATCQAAYECQSEGCESGRCGPSSHCVGRGPTMADAGVDAARPDASVGADASVPDATVATTAAETCMGAGELAQAGTASALPGYLRTLAGSLGSSNDYNPYTGAVPPLPPACSIVYDAAGKEIAWAVTLSPGEQLRVRYALTPTTVAPAMYLLDSCSATPTWPDYDQSTRCGNNEYRATGACGFAGCDPLEWTWTYPRVVGTAMTARKTFWLVLDHIGTVAPSSYQLDWRVVPAP